MQSRLYLLAARPASRSRGASARRGGVAVRVLARLRSATSAATGSTASGTASTATPARSRLRLDPLRLVEGAALRTPTPARRSPVKGAALRTPTPARRSPVKGATACHPSPRRRRADKLAGSPVALAVAGCARPASPSRGASARRGGVAVRVLARLLSATSAATGSTASGTASTATPARSRLRPVAVEDGAGVHGTREGACGDVDGQGYGNGARRDSRAVSVAAIGICGGGFRSARRGVEVARFRHFRPAPLQTKAKRMQTKAKRMQE